MTSAERRILAAIAAQPDKVMISRPRKNFWKVGDWRSTGPVARWTTFQLLQDRGYIEIIRGFAMRIDVRATEAGRGAL